MQRRCNLGICYVCVFKKLEHLYIIVDQNGWQGIGKTKDILNVKTLKKDGLVLDGMVLK